MRDYRESVDKFVNFNSFAITRLLAALTLILNGVISYRIFGDDVGIYLPLKIGYWYIMN